MLYDIKLVCFDLNYCKIIVEDVMKSRLELENDSDHESYVYSNFLRQIYLVDRWYTAQFDVLSNLLYFPFGFLDLYLTYGQKVLVYSTMFPCLVLHTIGF